MVNSQRSNVGRWSDSAVGFIAIVVVLAIISIGAQTKPPARGTRKPAPATKKTTSAPVELTCPSPLGAGITTKRSYCDVLTGRDPKMGVIIKLPQRRGLLTLRFNLHNRHTYSEEEVRMKRAFASYTATIGVLSLDNTLLTRAVVASEFRALGDLLERVGGGAGPGGVKAVAPVGSELVSLDINPEVTEVSLLGEKLTVVRSDGVPGNYSAAGRPIAIVSDATIEYVPAPAPARRRR